MRKAKSASSYTPADQAKVDTPSRIAPLRFRVFSEVVEFEPTAEFPILVVATEEYKTWRNGIADKKTMARITLGVGKMRRGLFGDWKDVGEGVFELRLDFGSGYRVYYAKIGRILIALLGGGDKSRQQSDIARAQRIWKELKDEIEQV